MLWSQFVCMHVYYLPAQKDAINTVVDELSVGKQGYVVFNIFFNFIHPNFWVVFYSKKKNYTLMLSKITLFSLYSINST